MEPAARNISDWSSTLSILFHLPRLSLQLLTVCAIVLGKKKDMFVAEISVAVWPSFSSYCHLQDWLCSAINLEMQKDFLHIATRVKLKHI